MTRKPLATMAALTLAGAALADCSSSDGDTPGASAPAVAESMAASIAASVEAAVPTGGGSATLVVGDATYEFDNFVCAFGYDNTESDIYSFSSNSFQELDGVRVQMQLNVADPSGGDALTGSGVEQEVTVDDIEDFENPTITIATESLDATFDGDNISAQGTFYDEVADPTRQEAQAGTFEATCGAGSRR